MEAGINMDECYGEEIKDSKHKYTDYIELEIKDKEIEKELLAEAKASLHPHHIKIDWDKPFHIFLRLDQIDFMQDKKRIKQAILRWFYQEQEKDG